MSTQPIISICQHDQKKRRAGFEKMFKESALGLMHEIGYGRHEIMVFMADVLLEDAESFDYGDDSELNKNARLAHDSIATLADSFDIKWEFDGYQERKMVIEKLSAGISRIQAFGIER